MSFFQSPPRLGNTYEHDPTLREWLAWRLPREVHDAIAPGLLRLGERACSEMERAAADAESNPPVLRRYDAWGRRVDTIETAAGWRALHAIAAEEGIVATAYEREHGPYSRVHQFARLYLFHPSSAWYSCPLAMTDGAARVLQALASPQLRERALPRLTSRDPARFWTSGQWMTERAGGSDVSGTETVARRDGDGYRLHGTKWFSSAATSDIALTLARHEDREGLGLFYLETRAPDGALNGIRIERLKDKLGTRAMPTAELILAGARAELLGEPDRGVRNIGPMLNVTRLYNSVCAVAGMNRGVVLAYDYARRRRAFGCNLADHALHRYTLARLRATTCAAFELVFHLGLLLGREETGAASQQERTLLRLLIPITKLYTAKEAVAVASEVLECFGGAGYIEDTGLPRLLRDAQVLPIWEGTTNVLSLDARRVLAQSDAFEVFAADIERRLAPIAERQISAPVTRALKSLRTWPDAQFAAREFCIGAARTFAASLLAEQAQAGNTRACAALRLYCVDELVSRQPQPPALQAADTLMY